MALNGSNYLLNFAAQNPPAAVSAGSVGSVRLQQAQTERYPSDNETGLTPAPANTAFGAEFTSQFVLVQLLQSILKKIIELLERVTGNNDPGTTAPPPTAVTEKYPSDTEDGGTVPSPAPAPTPVVVTKKYPSDSEDGGQWHRTVPPMPAPDPTTRWYETMKAPSDSEDGGTIDMKLPPMPRPNPDDQLIHTMKAPSDTEDGGGNNQIW
ncbi:MAG: hypothetical protein KC476_01285 [Cyanobacteria bacterium HKST-UBA06]|nr:hypothetical protein [Cyanobacteria bacterium HKST-UBA06]